MISIRDLKISQEFVQKIVDEDDLNEEFLEKYGSDTKDSHEIALSHMEDKSFESPVYSQQMFYTEPL